MSGGVSSGGLSSGSTSPSMGGGSSGPGATGGLVAPAPNGGAGRTGALAGAAGTGGLPAGGQSAPTTEGGAGAAAAEPNGGLGRTGLATIGISKAEGDQWYVNTDPAGDTMQGLLTTPYGPLQTSAAEGNTLTWGPEGLYVPPPTSPSEEQDYARLLVSATAPPGPTPPFDAFWFNPEETA